MCECQECVKKDQEIASLIGQVAFHKAESKQWRKLFNDQRGGETFNDLQHRYADQNVEISKLTLALKKAEGGKNGTTKQMPTL